MYAQNIARQQTWVSVFMMNFGSIKQGCNSQMNFFFYLLVKYPLIAHAVNTVRLIYVELLYQSTTGQPSTMAKMVGINISTPRASCSELDYL